MIGKMKSITNEGRTILFVSHNVGAVSNLCNSGLLLKAGNLEAIGDISDVVSEYINDYETASEELIWDKNFGPGDEYIRLKSVKITVDGKLCSNIPINKDIYIEIYYWNLKDRSSIQTSIHLLDKNGYPVFASGNGKEAMLNEDKWADAQYPVGLFKTTMQIPKNLLNDEIYYVTVIILTDGTNIHLKEDEVISFAVVDTGEMRGVYSGDWIGIIRPKLEWNTELMDKGM